MKKIIKENWKLILISFISGILLTIIILKFFPENKECVKEEREKKEEVEKVTEQPTVEKKEDISLKETISKKVPSKEITSKKVISKKTTEKITPKKIIPKKIVPKKLKSFSLSLEEEKFLVEELKKRLYPGSEEEEEKLFGIIELLKESGSLSKYNDLLCDIVEENLNYETFGAPISEKAICYLAKIGSEKSIPTLLWAFVNTENPHEREIAKKAIESIRKGRKIDLESSDSYRGYSRRSHRPGAYQRYDYYPGYYYGRSHRPGAFYRFQ